MTVKTAVPRATTGRSPLTPRSMVLVTGVRVPMKSERIPVMVVDVHVSMPMGIESVSRRVARKEWRSEAQAEVVTLKREFIIVGVSLLPAVGCHSSEVEECSSQVFAYFASIVTFFLDAADGDAAESDLRFRIGGMLRRLG